MVNGKPAEATAPSALDRTAGQAEYPFSFDQYASLVALFRRHVTRRAARGAVEDLAGLVYAFSETQIDPRRDGRAAARLKVRAAAKADRTYAAIARQATRLLDRIKKLTEAERRALDDRGSFVSLMTLGGTRRQRIESLADAARAVVQHRGSFGARVAKSAPRPARQGRPQETKRDEFVLLVGMSLRRHGIPVRIYHSGVYAVTLRAIIPYPLCLPAGDGIRHLIGPIVADIRRFTLAEIDEFFREPSVIDEVASKYRN